ncbi:tRNA 2-thiouridine(34) synthase MnmA [Anaerolineales bacterium HSG25]|nr:tRNA 2-thiouridine(34) synthase MnmA [Anaerolineales bacterium HSG25]
MVDEVRMTINKNAEKTVVVAMSGGVDSSVAAALLLEEGYNVVGLMLRLWAEAGGSSNRCCTPDAVCDARRVANTLGIPFYVRDYKETFRQTVVEYFIEGYAQGVTPNPCVMCNREIRFNRLLKEALSLGDYLATGHYVRIGQDEQGRYQLLKGIDHSKDQSYVLYTLTQKRLAHVKFPVGHYSKTRIRQIAKDKNLPVFNRPDSQDLCFLGEGDYRDFLQRQAPQTMQQGNIINSRGEVLGQHKGLAFYTIGQRKGLGIHSAEKMYVLDMDPASNNLTVGPAEELGQSELHAHEVNYISGEAPVGSLPVTAKIRYKSNESEAILTCLPDRRAHVAFSKPLRDITPGQAVTFFQDEQVIGGGIISK